LERILVVDPDDRVAALLASALIGRGYVIDRIEGGRRAAELAVAGDYALVLLELMLPGADGRDVLGQISRERPDRKVFVISSRDTVADRVECLNAGAVDFVGKPFNLEELLARIEVRVAEGRPQPAGHRFRHGLALDPMRRRARRGGAWVQLTEREYLLLAHLLGEGQDVYSREDLLAGVWGITDDGSSTYVEMYVHKLRSKLGPDAIKTVRGSGYCVNRTGPSTHPRPA
jgi:DNA-binding response OmpR family regulator